MPEPDKDETALFKEANRLYSKGDYEAAFKIFLELGDRGWEEVQVYVGAMYNLGLGTEKNDRKAEYWLRLAAERGEPEAQCRLGPIVNRKGNAEEMVEWYRKAADQDHAPAIFRLARCYSSGSGVARDRKKSIELLNEARKKGNIRAQLLYALELMKGAEGLRRIFTGMRLWTDACISGYKIVGKDKTDVRLQG